MPNSVSFHRVLKTTPEKIFRAFTNANAIAYWLPPYGFLCTVHELNPTVGGKHRMSFHNFSTEGSHSFEGKYIDVKQNEFIKYSDKFDDPNLPGEMTTSVWLKKVSVGTELKILQGAFPMLSHLMHAIWDGKNLWRNSPNWLSLKFRMRSLSNHVGILYTDVFFLMRPIKILLITKIKCVESFKAKDECRCSAFYPYSRGNFLLYSIFSYAHVVDLFVFWRKDIVC